MNQRELAPIAAEERARADHYALLSRLFHSPPDATLLATLAASGRAIVAADGDLARAWSELASAAGAFDQQAVREEYERLFIGTGRPAIFLYGSYYQAGFLMEEPLAELRQDLATLGFARLAGVGESEDHIAALADVMRHLIVAGVAVERQRAFFARHLQTWVERLADQLEAASAAFYPSVGRLLRSYCAIEVEAFSMA